jgi:hypothetical protein
VEGGGGGGCCSSSRPQPAEISALKVPLAPDGLKGGALSSHHHHAHHAKRRGAGAAGAAASAWLARQRRPGGALDASLLGRDAARCVMTFATTALSYLLMLAAMSFHIGIFFAVCSGIAVGSAIFGRYRSFYAVAHHNRDPCGC